MKQTNWKNTMNPCVKDKLSDCLEKYHFFIQITLLLFPLFNIFEGLIPLNSTILFYVNVLLVFIYIISLFIIDRSYVIKKHYCEIFAIGACFLSIVFNMKYSSRDSFLSLAYLGMYIVGITFYTRNTSDYASKSITYLLEIINYSLIVAGVLSVTFEVLNRCCGIVISNFDYFSNDGLFGGIYFNTNKAGFYAFVGLILNIYFLKKSKINIVGLLVNSFIVFFSGCRAAFIALFFCLLIYSFTANKKIRPILLGAGIVVAILLVTVTAKKMTGYSGDFLNQITGGRYFIWEDCFDIFAENRLFGTGLSNITSAACDVYGDEGGRIITCMGRYNNAHNGVINVITQTGIIGCVSFLLLGYKYSKSIIKEIKKNKVLCILALSIMVMDLLDIVLIFTDRLTAYVFLLIVAKLLLEKKNPGIFVSNYVEQSEFEQLYVKYVKPGIQIQKFDRLIVEGIEQNDVNIVCYTAIPASKEILDKTIIKVKNTEKFKYSLCINSPILKDIYILVTSFFKFLLIDYDFCIIDPLSPANALGASFVSLIRGIPCMGVITDLPEHMTDNTLYRKCATVAISNCSMYTLLSKMMNEKVNPQNKPYVLIEGFADTICKESYPHNNSIIYAGNLDEDNGIMTLIEAFEKSKLHEECNLVIFGDGNGEKKIINIASKDKHIQFKGVKPNREVLQQLYRAKLLINPRPTHEEFVLYSFPSKTIEYLGTGTPFASTKLPSIPDEYFTYIDSLQEGKVEDLIRYFNHFDDIDYIERLEKAEKGQEFLSQYKSKKAQTKKMLELLTKNI